MAVLTSYPCMNQEDFEAYKDSINQILATTEVTEVSHIPTAIYWVWPCIVMTNSVWSYSGSKKLVSCYHTNIGARSILKILGLTKEEIKIEFDMKNELPQISDSLEAREI